MGQAETAKSYLSVNLRIDWSRLNLIQPTVIPLGLSLAAIGWPLLARLPR